MEEEDDPPVLDDDFEVDFEAVDVVSFSLPLGSMGFDKLVLESFPISTR